MQIHIILKKIKDLNFWYQNGYVNYTPLDGIERMSFLGGKFNDLVSGNVTQEADTESLREGFAESFSRACEQLVMALKDHATTGFVWRADAGVDGVDV